LLPFPQIKISQPIQSATFIAVVDIYCLSVLSFKLSVNPLNVPDLLLFSTLIVSVIQKMATPQPVQSKDQFPKSFNQELTKNPFQKKF
jgi:hypothetical protein